MLPNPSMFEKMLKPIIAPMIKEFRPKLDSFLAYMNGIEGRTKRMEPAVLQLQNDMVLAHEKLNKLLELKDAKRTDVEPASPGGESGSGNASGDGTGSGPSSTP